VLSDAVFRRLCRARDYGHGCFAERIDTTALAREAAMSTFHFHRLFTGTFGITPHDFITQSLGGGGAEGSDRYATPALQADNRLEAVAG
jgi:hypothetical protein